MNVLIVVAHPREDSFSFAMANRYKMLAIKAGHTVDFIDLYREKHQQPFFRFEESNRVETTHEMTYFQEKISIADELVFVFPYWWGGMPAILKNFFDWNLSSKFAFEYVNSRPKGLLTNKSVKIFTTTGAPHFLYSITGANRRFRKTFNQQIIKFCGMNLTSFKIYGGLGKSSTDTGKLLEKVKIK